MRPEKLLAEKLNKLEAEIAVAESCSGGLLANRITDVPGSSDYFVGSVVAYSNQVKRKILGVREETLRSYGAVSGETAIEMAEGVADLLEADYALSTTGIAGPTGGTKEKPVGLVYIGFTKGKREAKSFEEKWEGDRWENKSKTVNRALDIMIDQLKT